ncbi:flavodoxin FldA, partial [Klebsiella michiganensis]
MLFPRPSQFCYHCPYLRALRHY